MKLTFRTTNHCWNDWENDEDDDKLETYIHTITSKIRDNGREVGKLEAYLLRTEILHPTDQFNVFDMVDQDVYDFYAELEKTKRLKILSVRDTLVLNMARIEEQYRGHGFVIKMIKAVIRSAMRDTFGDSLNILLLPHPAGDTWQMPVEKETGKKKLWDYYSKHFPIKRLAKGSDYGFFVAGKGWE